MLKYLKSGSCIKKDSFQVIRCVIHRKILFIDFLYLLTMPTNSFKMNNSQNEFFMFPYAYLRDKMKRCDKVIWYFTDDEDITFSVLLSISTICYKLRDNKVKVLKSQTNSNCFCCYSSLKKIKKRQNLTKNVRLEFWWFYVFFVNKYYFSRLTVMEDLFYNVQWRKQFQFKKRIIDKVIFNTYFYFNYVLTFQVHDEI